MNVSAIIDCVNSKPSGSSKTPDSGVLNVIIPTPAVIAAKASIHISTFRDIALKLRKMKNNCKLSPIFLTESANLLSLPERVARLAVEVIQVLGLDKIESS